MAKSNSSVSKTGKSADISAQEKIVQLKKDEIAADAEIARSAKRKLEHYESLQKAGTYLNDTAKKEIEFLKQDLKLQEDKEKALKTEQKLLSKLYETENKRKKLLKDSITDADEFASSLRSLGAQVGKDNKLFEAMNTHIDSVATTLNSVGQIVAELGDDQQNLKKQVIGATDAYKNLNNNITVAGKKMMQQKMTQSEYNQLIKDSYENFDEVISKIDQSTEAGKDLYKMMLASKNEMESFYKAAQKSEKVIEGLNTGLDQISSSGVPGVSELSNVIKSASQGGKALGLSIFALGAALGALAYNLGFVGDKVGDIAGFDKEIAKTTGSIDVLEKQLAAGAFGGRNFVVEKAMAQFSASMRQAAASFQAASKTALFGNAIGGVGYGAAQLQMAGIGADKVASGMTAAADATGRMPTAKMGADMAIMAARTGQSEESIASINEAFMRMDGMSETTALNMQEGLRSMAKQANINLGGLMTEMAESSKEMLGYQIKSGSALARQVTFARSMGVSFQDIAKAGQSMVLNYKDSIKSEMQLSAMLGKNVDLSEVRAKFASGDTEGALKSLQAQGLDPAKMDMFQQQMLQQATGMDLNTLSKINKNTGRTANLGEGNATAGNKSFLNRTVSAQATLEATNAMISSDTAIQMSKLDTEEQIQLQNAIKNNTGGIKDLKNTLSQQEALKDATIGLKTAIYGLITGLATFAAYQGIKSLVKPKGVPSLPKTSVPQPSGPLTKSGAPDMRFKANKSAVKGAEKAAVKGAEKAGVKGIAKLGAKGLGKAVLKKIPIIGALAGIGFALGRAAEGDWAGAAMEVASGAAGSIPGIGTAASVGIDTALAARDMGTFDKKPAATPSKAAKAPVTTPTAVAATAAVAATGGTSVVSAAKASEKWMQDKLTYMSGNLERVVDRTHKTMMNTAATTKELQTLNTNTKAIMNLTKTIEALTVATFQGSKNVSVSIDGKRVAYAFDKYKENTRGGDPNSNTKP
jgi:hypothetical protein